ncbi:MAG: O-antigen ligase family protein [Candidatus Roizmanbacteria bacterium]|nr:MAG: O-antigen ligase family protein [Candidatus Roizmanbacteria bacterium]
MEKLWNLLRWLDNYLLKLLLITFIFIIPLYPKLPFIDLEYTYISIRLEDFFIGFMLFVFIIQLLRKKVTLRKKFLILFILFWTAVFLSFIFGTYIQKTIQVANIGFLHSARRVEYMIVFFIALSLIKSKSELLQYSKFIFVALFLVSIYGIGQKFLNFPAVQTMNPEFARGHILYLTPEARISSTFGGHYDLAAYLVLLLPLLLSVYLWRKKFLYFVIFLVALFALTLTASRISSIAYIVSISAFLVYLRKWKLLITVLIFSLGLSFLSNNLIARFVKTFQIKQIFVNELTGQVVVPQKISTKELPAGSFYVEIKNKNTSSPVINTTNQGLLNETILSGYRDEARKEGKVLTASEEAQIIATASVNLKPVNTVISDISFATRLQAEWPRAINSFLKNPLLGTGPSSITEATDNDYLRWIGEFGALGTSLFLIIIFSIAKFVWQFKKHEETIYIGFLFGILGLLLNAAYIDVFEASKVAYYFWMISGLFVGSLILKKKQYQA